MMESLSSWLQTPLNWMLLGFGFGFVIFWHELGHFLAAKYVGIKVEQFAVGFGQALFSWRKGLGIRLGNTQKDYEHVVKEHLAKSHADQVNPKEPREWSSQQFDAAAAELGISDTEYRLNWIPLGGYVKMLGQDDMKPGQQADDPRAYNKKSVGARMLVVSAGVIMNIILAAIGFMVVFLVGFNSPPPVVGDVMVGSPAQRAGLEPGDRILTLDGAIQHDFTKIQLNSALADPTRPTPIQFRKPDGKVVSADVMAAKSGKGDQDFFMLGVAQPSELRGPDVKKLKNAAFQKEWAELPEESRQVKPGDTIVAVNGTAVQVKDYNVPAPAGAKAKDVRLLDEAIQKSAGNPVTLTVRDEAGKERQLLVSPVFAPSFADEPVQLLGMQMRPKILAVPIGSPATKKLKEGDVVLAIGVGNDLKRDPSQQTFRELVQKAGAADQKLSVTVLRDGTVQAIEGLDASASIGDGKRGLGIHLRYALEIPQTSEPVEKSTAAGIIPAGLELTGVNDKPVKNWFDVREALRGVKAGDFVTVAGTLDGKPSQYKLTASADDAGTIASQRYAHLLALHEMVEPRETNNPLIAAAWGAGETRDACLQVYLTVKRMFQGSVSYKSVSGPVGIFAAGYKFADRGTVWLMWFLSIISANLAVMNFLPIPIVDGGLFTFLIIEKIKGEPVSPRVQAVAQVVGLAILLSVFLLATYQDIARLPFLMR